MPCIPFVERTTDSSSGGTIRVLVAAGRVVAAVCAGPSESELRAALESMLEGADMTAVSYSQLHKKLEEKFNVRDRAGLGRGRRTHGYMLVVVLECPW